MCRRFYRRTCGSELGQSVSEYLVLAGMTTTLALLGFRIAGVALRQALKQAAMRILQVVTG